MIRETEAKAIKKARTCYDHFAGEFGVALTQALVKKSILIEGERDFLVTDTGLLLLKNFGINMDEIKRSKRSFSRKCLDGTEKKYHLGGSLGKAIVHKLYELEWVEPRKDCRAVNVTPIGRLNLEKYFNLVFS